MLQNKWLFLNHKLSSALLVKVGSIGISTLLLIIQLWIYSIMIKTEFMCVDKLLGDIVNPVCIIVHLLVYVCIYGKRKWTKDPRNRQDGTRTQWLTTLNGWLLKHYSAVVEVLFYSPYEESLIFENNKQAEQSPNHVSCWPSVKVCMFFTWPICVRYLPTFE